ncbi:MAG: ABC transporter permease [Acidobacteriota bacterium]|nr:ABC transporter permease [Acidobacteriota bacterium]
MAAFLRELRYSLRTLARNPAFTLAAVVTIGLGIGCSTAIFSAFNATVLRNGEMLAFQRQVLEQVRAIPGVMSASLGSNLPLSSGIYTMFMFQKPDRGWTVSPVMEENKVGANYFAALRIPVLRGRAFNHLDSTSTPCVAILNQTAAGDIWPGENPVGKVINLSAMAPFAGSVGAGNEKPRYCEIVGEVAGARFLKLVEKPGPEIYFPRLQEPAGQPVLMVRTAGTPLALANAIIGRADSIDKNQRVMWAFSTDQLITARHCNPGSGPFCSAFSPV